MRGKEEREKRRKTKEGRKRGEEKYERAKVDRRKEGREE